MTSNGFPNPLFLHMVTWEYIAYTPNSCITFESDPRDTTTTNTVFDRKYYSIAFSQPRRHELFTQVRRAVCQRQLSFLFSKQSLRNFSPISQRKIQLKGNHFQQKMKVHIEDKYCFFSVDPNRNPDAQYGLNSIICDGKLVELTSLSLKCNLVKTSQRLELD